MTTPAPERIDQHPLAYLLGLEGLALLRAFTGEYDRAFVEARMAEIRELLDAAPAGAGGDAEAITSAEGYDDWAPTYDQPGNALIDIEGPLVRDIVDRLPAGIALDAACGTGRHAAHLAVRGHRVIGVDGSAAMLEVARERIPGAEFHRAGLDRLPLPDDHVDVIVCGLALSHEHSLPPIFAEFARVLRPGGHLIVSDTRGLPSAPWYPMVRRRPDGRAGVMMARAHATSDFLGAALPLGLRLHACLEPRRAHPYVDPDGVRGAYREFPQLAPPEGEPPNIWALHELIPAATIAAYRDTPAVIVLHFELA
jgi:SAM-dependent methyltransferase